MAQNEEKPCPEIFTRQKLKFSAKLVEKNAILNIFLIGVFFCEKWLKNFRFSRKMKMRKNWKPHITDRLSLLEREKLKIDLYVATSENSNHFTKAKKWTSRCVPVGAPLGKKQGFKIFSKY